MLSVFVAQQNTSRGENHGKISVVMKQGQEQESHPAVALFLVRWWGLVKEGVGFSRWGTTSGIVGSHSDESVMPPRTITSQVSRTSHRIWVAFLALKSSGVSSSTRSPLPFTPSSRSFLYSFYRTEEEQRDCRQGHTGRQGQGKHTRQHSGQALRLAFWAQSHQVCLPRQIK